MLDELYTGVFKDVTIVGFYSNHHRYYPAQLLQKSIKLYEHAPVYYGHCNDEDVLKPRNINDYKGFVCNVRLDPERGLIADFYMDNPHVINLFVNAIEAGENIGFSHCIQASYMSLYINEKESAKIITNISKVYSVDLVDFPATTEGLIRYGY